MARLDDMETPQERQRRIREEFGHKARDYGAVVLQRLVDGPILDAYRAFCPAGKLSEKAWKRARDEQVEP